MVHTTQDHDLLLVRSVPLETAEEVLESCGRTLGNYLNYLPDGEVGLKRDHHENLRAPVTT